MYAKSRILIFVEVGRRLGVGGWGGCGMVEEDDEGMLGFGGGVVVGVEGEGRRDAGRVTAVVVAECDEEDEEDVVGVERSFRDEAETVGVIKGSSSNTASS